MRQQSASIGGKVGHCVVGQSILRLACASTVVGYGHYLVSGQKVGVVAVLGDQRGAWASKTSVDEQRRDSAPADLVVDLDSVDCGVWHLESPPSNDLRYLGRAFDA